VTPSPIRPYANRSAMMFKKFCALNTQPIHNERYVVRGESFGCVKLQPFGEFKADLILSHICHNRIDVW
jgi:hypothetical protein